MPEVAGDAACLVDPYDVQSIRAGLLHLIHDETYRERLVLNGLENHKRFSLDKVARQYADLYAAVAAQNA